MQNRGHSRCDDFPGAAVIATLEKMRDAAGRFLANHERFAQRRQRCIQLFQFLAQFIKLQFSGAFLGNTRW